MFPSPPSISWASDSLPIFDDTAKWWDVTFKIVYKKTVASILLVLSCLTVLMEAGCHVMSYSRQRPMDQETPSNIPAGTKASIPTARGELDPARNHLSELRSRSSIHQAFKRGCSPAWHWGTLRQRHSNRLHLDFLLTETKMINVCYFKLLIFGVVCCAAIGN